MGLGLSVRTAIRPFGAGALKLWSQWCKVCRSIPPISAAVPRSIPSPTAASDRSPGSGCQSSTDG
jgi:hypothetical protein